MKTLSLHRSNYAILAVIILGSVGVGYGIYLFVLKNVFSESERFATMSQSLADFRIEKETLGREEALLEEVKVPTEILDSTLIKKDTIDFIKTIESRAEDQSIFLDTPQFTTTTKKAAQADPSESISLQLRAVGDFINLMHFIEELSHLPYFVKIEKIQVSKSSTAGTTLSDMGINPGNARAIQATLQLKIFTQ